MAEQKSFKIFIEGHGATRELVVPVQGPRPSGGTGLPGSLLDMALASGIEIDHACGGVAACSTCHVWVRQGLASCGPAGEDEEDQLDKAPGVSGNSRLACQCVPDGSMELRVEIPGWNRNLVREGT